MSVVERDLPIALNSGQQACSAAYVLNIRMAVSLGNNKRSLIRESKLC